MGAEPSGNTTAHETPERNGSLRPATPSAFRQWSNWGLAAFLGTECVFGIWFTSEAWWDTLMWITVVGVLLINTMRRSPPISQDNRWWVWVICTASTLRFLAFESGDETKTAFWLLVFFNLLADTALLALGRSFSLLPARRKIRTGWMYRVVRHPAYTAYMLVDAVYVTQSPTPRNIAVLLAGMLLFSWRAVLEERLLSGDPVYRDYMQRVRWRFLPGLF